MSRFITKNKESLLLLILIFFPLSLYAQLNVSEAESCPCTVFQPHEMPQGELYNDSLYSGGKPVQVGMKFRSTIDGYITGVRFFKDERNIGTHTGQLYSVKGALLASVVFTSETASGWQEAMFPSPVAVNAGTTYIISYHSDKGFYTARNFVFNKSLVNGPLRALADGEDGHNGVYSYNDEPGFPSKTFRASSYWVDVIFDTNFEQHSLKVFPNPFIESTTIKFSVSGGGEYDMNLYDAKGAFVMLLGRGVAVDGQPSTIQIKGTQLAKGLYLVRFQEGKRIKSVKVVVEK